MNEADEYIKHNQDLKKEIDSWKLSPENYIKFRDLILKFFQLKSEFNTEVVFNRYFCAICSTKLVTEKSIDASPILEYLMTLQPLPNNEETFFYSIKEFLFMAYGIYLHDAE